MFVNRSCGSLPTDSDSDSDSDSDTDTDTDTDIETNKKTPALEY